MCNAWNHSAGCDCGWGGGDISGRKTSFYIPSSHSDHAIGEQTTAIKSAETYTTACWWCGVDVYYHTNGYGDSVLFDFLGYPWRVHSCWRDYWTEKKAIRKLLGSNTVSPKILQRIEQYESSSYFSTYRLLLEQPSCCESNDSRMAILSGTIRQINFIPDESSVAHKMGITAAKLRHSYGDLYTIDRYTKGVKLKNKKQLDEMQKAQYQKTFIDPPILAIKRNRKKTPKLQTRKKISSPILATQKSSTISPRLRKRSKSMAEAYLKLQQHPRFHSSYLT